MKLSSESKISLVATNVMSRTFFGNTLKVTRNFEGVIECQGQKLNHQFVVVDGSRHNLIYWLVTIFKSTKSYQFKWNFF